jgi:DNA polymerase I-like protein with 3'-5' exonuclease and polymerase domains
MPIPLLDQNLKKATLQKLMLMDDNPLIPLRLDYKADATLLNNTINKLVSVPRVYPTHLPTQASFRWSTVNPPLTNWPRACINQHCPRTEHEWTDSCWSVRDIVRADSDEIMISWDHDNIEGKIHDLVVGDPVGIEAHHSGFDLHTITCCHIFGYELPHDLRDPHKSELDAGWRSKYNWQGKDTKQRVLAKNFNHGSKYAKSWFFVYKIQGIEQYGVSRKHLGQLAKNYIASKKEAWAAKLAIMKQIQKDRVSRTLYGGRRIFFDSSDDTAKEGFSHMISGTVSDYNNMTLILLEQWLGDGVRLLHNAHDGDKIAVKTDLLKANWGNDVDIYMDSFLFELRQKIERPIEYNSKSLIMTVQLKVHK